MSLAFQPHLRYRMPVAFGPMPGPRQGIGGTRHENSLANIDRANVSFLTDADHLDRLLPPGFELDGEPIVTVEFMFITALQWLAGRGYNTLGVRFPVRYRGRETVTGPFLTVLWENMADPIVTGREELGFAKLFCDIPPPAILGQRRHYSASWEGHRFLEMELDGVAAAPPVAGNPIDGVLHYRYLPRVGHPGEADFAGAVITPATPIEISTHASARGSARFIESSWEQLPTLVHIVNILAALPIVEERGGSVTTYRGDVEVWDQRILK